MTELQGYYLGDQNLPNEHFGDSPAEVITNAQLPKQFRLQIPSRPGFCNSHG